LGFVAVLVGLPDGFFCLHNTHSLIVYLNNASEYRITPKKRI
jgi:hypothetical protein